MKKLVSMALVIVMLASFAVCVFADSSSEKARLIKGLSEYEVKIEKTGVTLVFEKADINAAKNYLNAYKGEVTKEMVDYVFDRIDAAAEIVKKCESAEIKSFRDIKKMNNSEKEAILARGNEAVEAFGLDIVYNSKTNKVDYVDSETGTLRYASNANLTVKKTDNAVNAAPIVAVAAFVIVAVAGSAVLVKKYSL